MKFTQWLIENNKSDFVNGKTNKMNFGTIKPRLGHQNYTSGCGIHSNKKSRTKQKKDWKKDQNV